MKNVHLLEKQVYVEHKPVPGVWETLTVAKDEDSAINCLDGVEQAFGELIQTKVGDATVFFNDNCAFRIRRMEVI